MRIKYIEKRGDIYQYVREVPTDLRELMGKRRVKESLKTRDIEEAKVRAAAFNADLEKYWNAVRRSGSNIAHRERYDRALKIARTMEAPYIPIADLVTGDIGDLIARMELAERAGLDNKAHVEAALGLVGRPGLKITEALDRYWIESRDEIMDKSEDQVRKWKNPRIKAINNLVIALEGDKTITELTREHATQFRTWWLDRVQEGEVKSGTANKDFTHIRSVFNAVDKAMDLGLEGLFDGIRLKTHEAAKKIPYSPDQVRDWFLGYGDQLKETHPEIQAVAAVVATLGCRPSEVVGFAEADIVLDAPIPFVHIRPNEIRRLKNKPSERDLPLVGPALDAMKKFPKGFKKYRGKPDQLSAAVNKYLAEHNLRPDGQTFYSLRHGFEDRLTNYDDEINRAMGGVAAGVRDRMAANLMGHKFDKREEYGAGAALEKKKQVIEAILPK